MKCRICDIWEILPDDVYCSYCGERLVGCELVFSQKRVYRDDHHDVGEIGLEIRNKGQSSLKIEDIRSEPAFVTVMDKPTHLVGLASGEKRPVSLQLKWKNLADEPVPCQVWVKTSVGEESAGFEVLPKPAFRVELPSTEIPIFVGASSEANAPIECFIEITKGKAVLQAEDITLKGIPEARIQLTGEMPIELDATSGRNTIPLPIVVNAEGLGAGKEYTATLKVVSTESGVEADKNFTIRTKRAPEIAVVSGPNDPDGRVSRSVFAQRESEFSLTVRNPGGVDFQLKRVEVETPQRRVHYASQPPIPVEVKSGGVVTLTFKVDARAHAAGDSISGEVRLFTNYAWLQKAFPLEIAVEEMPEYEHFVAVDFGNTNTCCVVANPDDPLRGQLVPLVEAADQRQQLLPSTIMPSVITYREISENGMDYLVGRAAKDLRRHPVYGKSIVASIKRQLGRVESIDVTINGQKKKLRPEVITGHIIQSVLDKTERRLKKKITRCIVTHPVGFTQKRIHALKQAFIDYGIAPENLETLSESTAAAFDYIIKQQGGSKKYTILVFDCGGSTTDITLLEVEETSETLIQRRIKPKIFCPEGKLFGGDDITAKLADLILKRCQEVYKGREIPVEPVNYEHDPQLSEIAYNNKWDIWEAAEQAKVSLSTYQTVWFGERPPSTQTQTQETDGDITRRLTITFLDRETLIVSGLEIRRADLEELIEPSVDEIIELAKEAIDAADIGTLDAVVPVGFSCQIPLIKKKLGEAFGADRLYWFDDPNELKECVASGAYFRYALTSEVGEIAIEDEEIKPFTTSRLGIRVINRSGQQEFREIIAKRMQVPVKRGIEVPVPSRKTFKVVICENAGKRDTFFINGKRNEDIQIIDELELQIPERVSTCEITMNITADLNLEVGTPLGSKQIEWQPIY